MVDFQALAQTVGINLGTGAVIGGLIGFTAKKVAKVLAILVGLELALFKFLESRQILTVNWDKLGASFLAAGEAAASQTPPSWLMTILSTLSVSGGFAGGFLLGFKKG
ncbi:FUN14 domain-containing protein [Haloglomus litoreum]|uniref:FUN14 domain-containing protein n=1 Tax=Haloglomus litoreum TaxID=3034026 RepID=UPI0023E8619A|nr:FUN14 domain-containing protein [Haloglomus sp. DT116]